MARYAAKPSNYPGTRQHPEGNVVVYDGNGRELLDCVMIDTETGLYIQYARDPKTNDYVVQRDAVGIAHLTLRGYAKLPITFRKVYDDGRLGEAHG